MTTADERLNNALTALEGYNSDFASKISTLDVAVTTANSKADEAAASASRALTARNEAVAVLLSEIADGSITSEKLADGVIPEVPNATTTQAGIVELATDVEVAEGVSTTLVPTVTGVNAAIAANASLQATDSVIGITRYATDSEVENRADVDAALRPSHLLAVPSITTGEGWQIVDGVQTCWGSSIGRGTVTFPLAFREETTPIITIADSSGSIRLSNQAHYSSYVSSLSNTGVRLNSVYDTSYAADMYYIAIGEPA